MSVVDKKLMFVNSFERQAGTIEDFTINIPSHLLTCQSHQRLRVVLNDLVLPYTWYNVQELNRRFDVTENGITRTIELELGSYHALQLRNHVQSQLNASTAGCERACVRVCERAGALLLRFALRALR
eukprot:COSAG01_NODE_16884_length_1196_cov_3.291892_1_plen_127_part_00